MTDAVRDVLEEWPDSLRALARAAGVDQSTLVRIRTGERPASLELAAAVAAALEAYSTRTKRNAAAIRRALKEAR